MRQHGIRKIETIVAEDGSKHDIKLHMETGTFSIAIHEEGNYQSAVRFDGTLEEVRSKAKAWLKDNTNLKFEPMLWIKSGEDNSWQKASDSHIDLEYKRYFKAVRPDGSTLWKEFRPVYTEGGREDAVNGEPGNPTRGPWTDKTAILLPYTPERWSALRMIGLMVRQLNERMAKLVKDGKFDDALKNIASQGMLALMGPETVRLKKAVDEIREKQEKERK